MPYASRQNEYQELLREIDREDHLQLLSTLVLAALLPPDAFGLVGMAAVVVGFVGSLKAWHGIEVLAEAFTAVAERADLHLLAHHPTPPVFDGPEDRNGRRNHDEAALWTAWLDGAQEIL